VAILFSGGLDSSVLAALTDRVWPENESIDLLNVAFPLRTKNNPTANKFDVPDRLTGLQALEELKKLNPSRKWNFCEVFLNYYQKVIANLFSIFLYSCDY
jgi:asparagine synthetase B (glutamine-hydrolysing)